MLFLQWADRRLLPFVAMYGLSIAIPSVAPVLEHHNNMMQAWVQPKSSDFADFPLPHRPKYAKVR